MKAPIPVRITIREVDYMPTMYRWVVDFCETPTPLPGTRKGDYIPAMSRFFESEDLAKAHALLEAAKLKFDQVDDRTWRKPDATQSSSSMQKL